MLMHTLLATYSLPQQLCHPKNVLVAPPSNQRRRFLCICVTYAKFGVTAMISISLNSLVTSRTEPRTPLEKPLIPPPRGIVA